MKKLIAVILFVVSFQLVEAQTPALNAAKYENYRARLLQEFMIGVGPGAGMSIPASIRDTVSGFIYWGDATIDLGYYIGVLATEHHLKLTNGINPDSTVRELFYALSAINRLDFTAEIYFGDSASLNGFFIRDDVTIDSLNLPQVISHLNQNTSIPVITQISSDLSAANPTLKEMSLDQVIHLLAGLSLVIKFVPDTAAYYENSSVKQFLDFETSLKQEAKNIMKRLVNYMKEGDPVQVDLSPADSNLLGIQGTNWDFIIKNPVTGLNVARGPNAVGIALGFVGAKYRFTGEDSPTIMTSLYQQSLSVFIWLQDNILPNNQDDKALLLNALCNCWPNGDYMNNMTFLFNAQKIGSRAFEQSYDYIPLLHNVLFEQPNFSLNQLPTSHPYFNNPSGYYVALLDSAPAGGPYNYGNGNYAHWEWSSSSRNIHPQRRGDSIPDFPGDYNGLDYMLFYNLQQISNTIVINVAEQLAKNKTLSPNPCSSSLIIPLPVNKKSNVIIYSLDGKEIYKVNNITSNYNLNCDEFLPGLYILKIINGERTEAHKLFFNTY